MRVFLDESRSGRGSSWPISSGSRRPCSALPACRCRIARRHDRFFEPGYNKPRRWTKTLLADETIGAYPREVLRSRVSDRPVAFMPGIYAFPSALRLDWRRMRPVDLWTAIDTETARVLLQKEAKPSLIFSFRGAVSAAVREVQTRCQQSAGKHRPDTPLVGLRRCGGECGPPHLSDPRCEIARSCSAHAVSHGHSPCLRGDATWPGAGHPLRRLGRAGGSSVGGLLGTSRRK